ncbi:MAG: aldo/keto reductase [Candidatus Baltobacteraceae bacterium]
MKQRTIGTGGVAVSAIGFGCMGLTWAYGSAVDTAAGTDVLNHARDIGVTLFDTADMYGPFTNETLVGEALHARRGECVIATKCGIVVHGDRADYDMRRNGTPAHIRAACDASLQRLQTGVIDLYQLHRVDPEVPVEESVGAMAELVAAGKVRAIGLSEVDVQTLERAGAVHPIASLQSEYSLFERNVEREILPYCKQHGIALLAYSPLGRGFLTGRLTQAEIRTGDFRATLPRFQAEAFEHNRAIVQRIEAVAARAGAAPGQVALAWLLAKGENVIPIPGTKRRTYLEENAAAAALELSAEDVRELDELPAPVGDRYAQANPTRS